MSEYLFTSESVSEGHPDKVADQISDAVLDAILAQDKFSRVAAETLVNTGLVVMAGRNHHQRRGRFPAGRARDHQAHRLRQHRATVSTIKVAPCWSPTTSSRSDIAQGVDEGKGLDLDQGAGDQGLMFGYACDETPQLMPLPIYLAHRLVERQSELRRDGRLPWLRPDAKSQVTIRYVDGKPDRIDTVVLSTQHAPEIEHKQIDEAVIEKIIKPVLPKNLIKGNIRYLVNPTGTLRDRRSAGRLRPDRAQDHRRHLRRRGASRRRRVLRQGSVARSTVPRPTRRATWPRTSSPRGSRASARCRCPTPSALPVRTSVMVTTFGTGKIPDEKIAQLVQKHFDLRPKGIIQMLDLLRPIYGKTAAYGHFGRDEPEFSWENMDKVAGAESRCGS